MNTILKPGDLKKAQDVAGYDPLKDPNAPVQFEYLNETPPYESVIMLYYGGSGVGKTVFVGSAGPRTLIINIGQGEVVLKTPWARNRFYKSGFPIIATINEEKDPKTGYFIAADAFDKVKDAIEWGLDKFPDRFDTIAVDDATALKAFAMNKGLELNEDFNRSRTLAMSKTEKSQGAYVPAVQDYGAEMDLIDDFMDSTKRICRAEKKHFIMTAHERYIYKKMKDQSGKVIGEEVDKVRPGFTGKTFPDEITAHFDLVWHAEVVRTTQGAIYRCHTEDSMGIKAKSRYPETFKNPHLHPDFLKVVATIKAANNAGTLQDTEAAAKQ